MNSKTWIVLGSLSAFIAVAAGAFGAHALKERLSAESLNAYEAGARYQMYHSLALLCVGVLLRSSRGGRLIQSAGYAFLLGILLFSGSLYALALTDVIIISGKANVVRALGPITPLGGLAFLAGWALLAVGAILDKE